METYLDGTGYNTVLLELWDWQPVSRSEVVDLRGILSFESWYPIWILRKYINFRPCYTAKSAVSQSETRNFLNK